jgi:WD repeat-containing protein 68
MYNSSSIVPGSLKPGGSAATTTNSGPMRPALPAQSSTAPTVPHINTNAQQYILPTRTNTTNMASHSASHSYSRSSPAGLTDQKYIPFSAGGQNPLSSPNDMGLPPKYPQTPQQKHYFGSQTPTGGGNMPSAHSPLALEQIRPRANSVMNDEGSMFGEIQPTNSNYMAPWAVFAFDWCKYPVMGGNSAGKMAIGSYLEDPHNFVRFSQQLGEKT